MPKRVKKNVKNRFFVIVKYQDETHVSTSIFQGLFKNIAFRSVALVSTMLMATIDFTQIGLFTALCQ